MKRGRWRDAHARERRGPRGPRAAQLDRAFDLAAGIVERGDVPCAVLGVSDARRTIRCQAFGSQDGEAIDPGAISPVFSVTKPMVAAAAAQLWERGLIALHDPVAAYLPGFEANGKEGILVRHLLTHTSGMAEQEPHAVLRASGTAAELERSVLATGMDALPGTRQRYSNTAFIALGMIIARVSGVPLDRYMDREIFLPLGMSSTGFDPSRFPGRTILRVPNLTDLGMGPTIEALIPLRLAPAGLFSTAEDVLRFGREFLAGSRPGRILGPAARTAMMSPQTPGVPPMVPGDFDGWVTGLGWYLPAPPSHKVIAVDGAAHSGAGGCQVFVSPRWGIAISVISARIRYRTERILNAVLGCLAEG